MANSLLLSPAFIISAMATIFAGGYSYIYLPVQMRKAYRQSLLTLARAVETKDIGSEGHGERVAEFVVAVAREMRLTLKQIRQMEYAAFLEDIGNVRVPHAILNKVDPLTEEEFAILKNHTVIGAEVVEQVKFLRNISPIIRHHHEAWDGSGYPDGLKGKDIPLGARILSVCTAYEVMQRTRVYRDKLDESVAINEIRAGSGTKYDPDVVRALLKVLRKRQRLGRNSLDT